MNALSADDVAFLVHVLVAARMVEADEECQESELHALATLKESHHLSSDAIARLRYLPPESVTGSMSSISNGSWRPAPKCLPEHPFRG